GSCPGNSCLCLSFPRPRPGTSIDRNGLTAIQQGQTNGTSGQAGGRTAGPPCVRRTCTRKCTTGWSLVPCLVDTPRETGGSLTGDAGGALWPLGCRSAS